jgi:hypothetical protein
MFVDGGYGVVVNGEPQRPGRNNPFPDLAAAMPPDLWRKVSHALERVLDPERGGDAALSRLLERTMEAERERREKRSA